jgi:hypothetical protein
MSGLLNLTDDDLARMEHLALMQARNAPGADQSRLAPFEHRAYAREQAQRSPLSALGMLGMIPAYQLAKLLGLHGSRTGPSLEQMRQGFVGVGEGLLGK